MVSEAQRPNQSRGTFTRSIRQKHPTSFLLILVAPNVKRIIFSVHSALIRPRHYHPLSQNATNLRRDWSSGGSCDNEDTGVPVSMAMRASINCGTALRTPDGKLVVMRMPLLLDLLIAHLRPAWKQSWQSTFTRIDFKLLSAHAIKGFAYTWIAADPFGPRRSAPGRNHVVV